jgi:hypothetical protein
VVRGNLVEDVTVPCCYTNGGGIAVDHITNAGHIAGNTLRRVHGAGVSINQTDTATIQVDSNAVSSADTAAVRLLNGGTLLMRGNNIRNNALDGLSILTSFGVYAAHGNAFQGNGRYALYSTADATVDATVNWWGVPGVAAAPGDPGADSVSGVIDYSSPLSDEPAGLPSLAPPALVASAPAATAVRLPAGLSLQAASLDATPGPRPRVPPNAPARAAVPAPRLPTGGVMAERLSRTIQAMTQRRAERDARLAARRSVIEARVTAEAAARGAREVRKTQRRTARPEAPKQ